MGVIEIDKIASVLVLDATAHKKIFEIETPIDLVKKLTKKSSLTIVGPIQARTTRLIKKYVTEHKTDVVVIFAHGDPDRTSKEALAKDKRYGKAASNYVAVAKLGGKRVMWEGLPHASIPFSGKLVILCVCNGSNPGAHDALSALDAAVVVATPHQHLEPATAVDFVNRLVGLLMKRRNIGDAEVREAINKLGYGELFEAKTTNIG